MFLFSKIDLRRILATCLVLVTFLIGSAIAIGPQNQAFAEVLKQDTPPGISGETVLSDVEYESAKANRNQLQAELSKQADDEDDSKSVAEKLNLDEIVPPAVKNTLDE
ncbi:MAG: hypothetical protein ACFCU7_11995 [Pleurocapsa sp.]